MKEVIINNRRISVIEENMFLVQEVSITPTVAANAHYRDVLGNLLTFTDSRKRILKDVYLQFDNQSDKDLTEPAASFLVGDLSANELKANVPADTLTQTNLEFELTPQQPIKDLNLVVGSVGLNIQEFYNGSSAMAGLDTIIYRLVFIFRPYKEI